MHIRLVPFCLSISITSLIAFCVFAWGVSSVEQEHIEAEKRADANLERALEAEWKYESREQEIDSIRTVLKARTSDRVLWLARAIYSETTKPKEMRYVGWVVRNRVDVNYNGKSTYRDIVLDDKQFSAFNRSNPKRDYYLTLDADHLKAPFHKSRNWFQALDTSRQIVNADSSERPFSASTLYFYSEVSMPGYKPHPVWASRFSKVPVPDVEEKRFRFFADHSYNGSPPLASSSETASVAK